MPADTFGITLGIPQGADHHFSAGQAVAGVQIAQVALGMEFTGFNDLEKVRNGVRLYRAGGLARLPGSFSCFICGPAFLSSTERGQHGFNLLTGEQQEKGPEATIDSSVRQHHLSPISPEGTPSSRGPSHASVGSAPSAASCEHLVWRECVQWSVERKAWASCLGEAMSS